MKFGTKAIHAGQKPDPSTGAIMTPIYQTSTYVQEGVGVHKGYEYSRTSNPTRNALEENIAALEGANYGYAFGSGMAAADTVIKLLKPGDEVIASNDLYGGSYRMFTQVFAHYGIKFHFVSMKDTTEVEATINDKTKLIWIETPTNPLMNIVDIKAMSDLAKDSSVMVCVDNTFASPYLQQPISLGADIVLHSATKYLGGHSDVILGALVTNDEAIANKIAFIQKSCGAVCGPFDAFLVLRGIKTLHLRMQRHCENGAKVADYLQSHTKVGEVHWPGFTTHQNHIIAKRQMKDYGGMLSFSLKNDDVSKAAELVASTHFFSLAESLGGVESLIGHPATMTHASIPKEEREKVGLKDSLIRLSVGIEHIDDLLKDLDQALSKV